MKPSNQQESYVRARDNPFFEGMRKGEAAVMNKNNLLPVEFQEKINTKINRSTSDIGARRKRITGPTLTQNATFSTKNSPSNILLEPVSRSSSGRWSKTSSPIVSQSDSTTNTQQESNEFTTAFSPIVWEAKEEECFTLSDFTSAKTYSVCKRQTDLSDVPLPISAAIFYNGPSPVLEVVESCESIHKLNMYLKARKDEVKAGVPGRFLHAVVGSNIADVGSVSSSIMYAFYLAMTLKNNEFCTVPIINIKRADLGARVDIRWLLDSCHIDLSSLLFIDEIDLNYYDLFGSLKLVLVNSNKLPMEQEALREAIVEVFGSTKEASCCTEIAEKFSKILPEILVVQGFSRLLLAGILMDTGNLSSPHCTSKDKYITTLLINGAGRFGCNGLYQILKHKNHDSSDVKVIEILQKEFKKWTVPEGTSRFMAPNIGMSSTGMSIAQLLSYDPTSIQDIVQFQNVEKLGILMVVSGYYDSQKKFKREILVCAESNEVMKNILAFLNTRSSKLPLKALHQQGPKDDMIVFEIEKVTSRKTIEQLLEEYISAAN